MKLPSRSLEEVKSALAAQVDAQAEAIRLSYLTPGSGQALTYSLKEAEARAVLADPSAAAPHIAAEAAVRGIDAADMAALVVRAADDWRALSAKLEARRQAAKIAVAAAPSPAAARAAARIAWPPETGFRHDHP